MTRGKLAFLGENLQHEGGRGHRQSEADDQRRGEVQAERQRNEPHQGACNENLRGTESEYRAVQDPQPRRLQFEADDEKEKHDAEFREMQDVVDGGDELQPPRTDDDARSQVAEHRAELEASEQRHGNDRGGKEEGGFAENAHLTPGARTR